MPGSNVNSLIDHILVNTGAKANVPVDKASIFKPGGGDGDLSLFPDWRATFSDHFPLSFPLRIRDSDTDVDFFELHPVWDELFPAEQSRIVTLLVERVEVRQDGIEVRLRGDGLRSLVAELGIEKGAQAG